MTFQTFTMSDVVRFCFMTESEFDAEIGNRVFEQAQLKTAEDNLTNHGRKKQLKEEIEELGRMKIIIAHEKVKQKSKTSV